MSVVSKNWTSLITGPEGPQVHLPIHLWGHDIQRLHNRPFWRWEKVYHLVNNRANWSCWIWQKTENQLNYNLHKINKYLFYCRWCAFRVYRNGTTVNGKWGNCNSACPDDGGDKTIFYSEFSSFKLTCYPFVIYA